MRTSITDPNSTVTSTAYDRYGRPESIEQGGIRKAKISYSNAERWVKTCRDQKVFNDKKTIDIQHYDGLGRLRLSRQLESGGASACDSGTEGMGGPGIKVERGYRWDAQGHHEIVSNPYRTTADETAGWTLTTFDPSGRISRTGLYAGSALPAAFGGANGNLTGEPQNVYDVTANGRQVRSIDAAGKIIDRYSDAFGRLTRVQEAPGVTGFGLITKYQYDGRDLLKEVCQNMAATCGQSRTFTYDPRKHLLSAMNPENGLVTYTYDANGNLETRTAAGVETRIDYDKLNRPVLRTYPGGGAGTVTYRYDTAPNFGRGRLHWVDNGTSKTEYNYDSLGGRFLPCRRRGRRTG